MWTCILMFSTMSSFTVVAGTGYSFSDDVSGMLHSIQGMIGNLQDYVGDKQGCKFQCPNGSKPRKNRSHQPSSNGCGAFGFKLEMKDYFNMNELSKCCEEHDFCYDTCNKDKDDCDGAFSTCLKSLCKKIKKITSDDTYKGCLTAADIFYAGTVALGCKPYKDAQAKACLCSKYGSSHSEL